MKNIINRDEAESLAIEALGFIAGNDELLQKFLALTGIGRHDLRQAAAQAGFFAGVLNFLCANEADLLNFCISVNIQPEQVNEALAVLPGGYQEENI